MLSQDFVYIKGNSVLLYIPLLICNVIFFEFVDALFANLILIFVFCTLFTNGFFINIFLMILLLFINRRLKEKIYVERIEVFLSYLFGFLISLNFLYYLIESYLNNTLLNMSLILTTAVIQFILDSIFGIFIYFIIERESKYLLRLKKGRSLKEE
ncbi:hypothetical protein [Caldicellulosiruptor morganii]|uniref:Uncharacterized protein n=1 Tax=Caldicellulosiruptor morganii TaxID=1387555 RepID=A0ABY7BN94_9FIRM|nr:hypothetical protein [Caldicellulosiruptor morganii]WAM32874.1 hypothetical protein OTK00_001326 [Caldicellulosiruptor morganii]